MSASPREIRSAALQALYQLDARGEQDLDSIRESVLGADAPLAPRDADKAVALALEAFRDRREADLAVGVLAPEWPAHRQPAVDRAILRLAHFEITSGRVHPAIAVNEAVELAKRFSDERSPAFVNGVLDKILKRTLAERAVVSAPGAEAATDAPDAAEAAPDAQEASPGAER